MFVCARLDADSLRLVGFDQGGFGRGRAARDIIRDSASMYTIACLYHRPDHLWRSLVVIFFVMMCFDLTMRYDVTRWSDALLRRLAFALSTSVTGT